MKDKYSSGYQPDFFDKDIDIKLSVRGMSSWFESFAIFRRLSPSPIRWKSDDQKWGSLSISDFDFD